VLGMLSSNLSLESSLRDQVFYGGIDRRSLEGFEERGQSRRLYCRAALSHVRVWRASRAHKLQFGRGRGVEGQAQQSDGQGVYWF
jgi:hypothetical protein